jgi:DeoR family suf operon transcriptional repressor
MVDQKDNEHLKSTRERVLQTLLTSQQCTINELAQAVDINPISVRHHITRLQADGLVDSEEERHGVGRPRRVYFLTENGLEHFPTRYLRLTLRLLGQLKETLPQSTINKLFAQMAKDVAGRYDLDNPGQTMEDRLNLMKKVLRDEGFNVDWVRQGDYYHIREVNCPYFHIGQNYPEVCFVDQALISTVLSLPAEKVQCMLDGDSHCTYIVPTLPISEKQEV